MRVFPTIVEEVMKRLNTAPKNNKKRKIRAEQKLAVIPAATIRVPRKKSSKFKRKNAREVETLVRDRFL